jgi:hypothetical protein
MLKGTSVLPSGSSADFIIWFEVLPTAEELMNGNFHCYHIFIIGMNLSHYYGNIFRPNMVIWRQTSLKKYKHTINTEKYFRMDSDLNSSETYFYVFCVFTFLWFLWPGYKHIRLKHFATIKWCFSETLVNFYQTKQINAYKTIIFLDHHICTILSHTSILCDIIG